MSRVLLLTRGAIQNAKAPTSTFSAVIRSGIPMNSVHLRCYSSMQSALCKAQQSTLQTPKSWMLNNSLSRSAIPASTSLYLKLFHSTPQNANRVGFREVYQSRAMYDFQPQQAGDLGFKKGDVITITKQEGEWWEGELHGQVGQFPYNYVTTPVLVQEKELAREEYRGAERQMDSLTTGVKEHLQKVYTVMGSAVGLCGAGAMLAISTPLGAVHPIIPALGALVPGLWLYMSDHRKQSPALRIGLLGSLSVLSGMAIAPMIGLAIHMNPMLIPTALGLTTAMFGAMTGVAMFAKKRSFLAYGPALFGGMLVLCGAGIAGMFVPVTSAFYPILHNVYLYGGLALFSVFVAFDTQNIITEYEHGHDDVVRHATDLFINFKSMFVRILNILMMRND